MSINKTEVSVPAQSQGAAEATVKAVTKKTDSILDKGLALLSSVRFGLVMLGLLLTCCMIGMLIMQINVEGFEKYYQQLTPAKRDLYQALGFFDIYHSWYFSLLLAITGLNIILASIDRFPAAWQYVVKPKKQASPKFIAAQMFTAESEIREKPEAIANSIRAQWKKLGFRSRVSTEGERITVFAQKNVWNRLGAYVVHVALLTIFIGGFMTNKYGLGGQMQIMPGVDGSNEFIVSEFGPEGKPRPSKAFLPFKIECRDIQQKLVRPEGGLDANNTIDWLSFITIVDGNQRTDLDVHLNHVGDYKGYRFFQSMFNPFGNAREITISFRPKSGGEVRTVKIGRRGSAFVEGIGTVEFSNFYCDFTITSAGADNDSPEYFNPAAELVITGLDGQRQRAFAFFDPGFRKMFFDRMATQMGKDEIEKVMLVNGNEVTLDNFEKVSTAHTLTIQYDPGRTPVYIGFLLLSAALCGVFFFAHQRVWAVIEPEGKGSKVYFGGNTNRNRPAFEGRFKRLINSVIGGGSKDE